MTDTPAPRIVVGVDGSPSSVDALRWALRIANTTGATIDATFAWDFATMSGGGYLAAGYAPERDAETILNRTVDSVAGTDCRTVIRRIVQQGYPAKVLLDSSRGAQMLIVGSRGHGGFVGLLLGSVSAHCAEHATCPVLVVHGHNAPGHQNP